VRLNRAIQLRLHLRVVQAHDHVAGAHLQPFRREKRDFGFPSDQRER
jgi:hypothetical protein